MGPHKTFVGLLFSCLYPVFLNMRKFNASVTLFFDADNKHQGDRSLKCDYSFTGNSGGQPYEQIRLEKIWTHRFRTDLSFHPVSLSLWLSITMYSWLNFRPGTGAFDEYRTYLKDRGLLNDRRTSK